MNNVGVCVGGCGGRSRHGTRGQYTVHLKLAEEIWLRSKSNRALNADLVFWYLPPSSAKPSPTGTDMHTHRHRHICKWLTLRITLSVRKQVFKTDFKLKTWNWPTLRTSLKSKNVTVLIDSSRHKRYFPVMLLILTVGSEFECANSSELCLQVQQLKICSLMIKSSYQNPCSSGSGRHWRDSQQELKGLQLDLWPNQCPCQTSTKKFQGRQEKTPQTSRITSAMPEAQRQCPSGNGTLVQLGLHQGAQRAATSLNQEFPVFSVYCVTDIKQQNTCRHRADCTNRTRQRPAREQRYQLQTRDTNQTRDTGYRSETRDTSQRHPLETRKTSQRHQLETRDTSYRPNIKDTS